MPPPWRERSRRKDWKLGRESSESLISEDSQVSTTQIISGECKEQRADNSSNLGRRLRELKKKSFKDFEEVLSYYGAVPSSSFLRSKDNSAVNIKHDKVYQVHTLQKQKGCFNPAIGLILSCNFTICIQADQLHCLLLCLEKL